MFETLLVNPLFNLLAVIYAYVPGRDFGVAIIVFTVLVRLLLWPLVSRQLHSSRAIQKLQPEVERIKAEAGTDTMKRNQMLMELYKEKGINPLASLWPLLIQLPLFFALFSVFNHINKTGEIERLAYEPVKHLAAIADIINQGGDFVPKLFGSIVSTQPSILLAFTAGLMQFIQSKQLAPKQKSNDPQAQMLMTMIYFFPIITFVSGVFFFPAALSLYWTVLSAVAIIQQTLLLRRDANEMNSSAPDKKTQKFEFKS